MGVLSCDRVGCDSIMCDRLSYEFGYICSDCFEEMVDKRIPHDKIKEFMDTEKDRCIEPENPYTYEYYSKIFPIMDYTDH
jgi:hypothetical protein